jgi:hypothetical protein
VKTARTATYNAEPAKLLEVALDAARGSYKIAGVDQAHFTFITQTRVYSPEGDLESAGAENFVQARDRSVAVQFIVQVEGEPHRAVITVTPKTLQILSGSPQPRELKPDDPGLPPFVRGRADALAYAIYSRAKSFAVAAPP